jgi:LemA protein
MVGPDRLVAALVLAACLVTALTLIRLARASYLALAAQGRRIDQAWSNLVAALEARQAIAADYLATLEALATTPAALEEPIRRAGRALAADDPAAPITHRAGAAAQTTAALHVLLATIDSLPDLEAAEEVRPGHREVVHLEGVLSARRELYDTMVADYDRRLASWPGRVWARLRGWRPRPAFTRNAVASGPSESGTPPVG